MNESLCPGLWFREALVALALAVSQACVQAQAIPQGEQMTWDSPKMRQIEKEWQSLDDAYTNMPEKIPGGVGKDKYGWLEGLKYRLLQKRLSDRDLRQLAAAAGPIPDRPFTNSVVEFMARAFIEAGDRGSLVTLLSRRCPPRIGHYLGIEFWLASWGYKFQDPVLILAEAYSKCESPETRHILAAAMRRGFGGHGIVGKDDADYVNNAQQWYEKEKDHLAVNIRYVANDADASLERYEKNPKLYESFPPPLKRQLLFEKTASSQASPSNNEGPEQTKSEPADYGADDESPTTAEKELAKLEGIWEVAEATNDGEPVAQGRIKSHRLLFHKGIMQWKSTGPNAGKEETEYRLRLDVQQKPWALDLIEMPEGALKKEQTTPLIYELQEETTAGIFELDGGTPRICLPAFGTTHRPTSFKTEKGSLGTSLLLKRVKE